MFIAPVDDPQAAGEITELSVDQTTSQFQLVLQQIMQSLMHLIIFVWVESIFVFRVAQRQL